MKKTALTIICFTIAAFTAAAAEKPVLRVGLFSDTHVTNDIKSCEWVKKVWTFFRDQEPVDLVVNLGDIADYYYPQGFRHYRNTINAIFPDAKNKPAELYVYANHDRLEKTKVKRDMYEIFAEVKKHLEIPNDPDDTMVLKGYPFLVVHQYIDIAKYEKMLTELAAAHPGKPIFIMDHLPASAAYRRRDLLRKFPQAVHLSGHTHGSLYDERRIWQDGYTALNLASLGRTWAGRVSGSRPEWKMAYEFCIMDVYKDKIVFRRFSLLNNQEYRPENPWTIPLPYDDATAPFKYERRKAESTVPEFAADAKISVAADGIPFRKVTLTISPAEGARHFNLEIAEKAKDGNWKTVARKMVFNNFYLLEKERSNNIETELYGAYFESGREYRFTATPENFFGKTGKSISTEWLAPKRTATKVLFESKDPMNDKRLAYFDALNGGKKHKMLSDGFYHQKTYYGRLTVPDEVWNIPHNTRIWITVDIHSIQDPARAWTILWRNPVPQHNAHSRITTYTGNVSNRYVMQFRHRKDMKYYLLVREGADEGKIRFNYLKIEQFK